MRTPLVRESFLLRPLSSLLGTPGSVRVLRELMKEDETLSVSGLADRTRLNPQTVRNALGDLTAGGVVQAMGQGRSLLYRADVSHPLYLALASLFRAEAERYQTVLEALAGAAEHVRPTPLAVWAYGALARGEDSAESDIDLALVAADEQAEASASRYRELIAPVQGVHRVWVSVVALSPSDVRRMVGGDAWWQAASERAIPLFGEAPATLSARLARPERPRPPFAPR